MFFYLSHSSVIFHAIIDLLSPYVIVSAFTVSHVIPNFAHFAVTALTDQAAQTPPENHG